MKQHASYMFGNRARMFLPDNRELLDYEGTLRINFCLFQIDLLNEEH